MLTGLAIGQPTSWRAGRRRGLDPRGPSRTVMMAGRLCAGPYRRHNGPSSTLPRRRTGARRTLLPAGARCSLGATCTGHSLGRGRMSPSPRGSCERADHTSLFGRPGVRLDALSAPGWPPRRSHTAGWRPSHAPPGEDSPVSRWVLPNGKGGTRPGYNGGPAGTLGMPLRIALSGFSLPPGTAGSSAPSVASTMLGARTSRPRSVLASH